jgi:hypothetical protein
MAHEKLLVQNKKPQLLGSPSAKAKSVSATAAALVATFWLGSGG